MRRLTIALALVSTLAVGAWPASGAAPDDGRAQRAAHRGTNILVVGTDSREGLSAAEKRRLNVGGKGCNCTDVMMLVHLSADMERATVVSVPRDSYVPYAQTDPVRKGKINGAYALGRGPQAVATVEQVTKLHIDHYLETDFTGFERAVNGLGGATVCTDQPLKDVNSGLDLPAGVHRTDGRGTLRYVRARHIGRPGDLGRVRRQQRTVSDLLVKLRADRALADPAAAYRTATTLLKSVRTDDRTDVWDLVRIATALGRLDHARTEFATVPIREFDHRVDGVGSTLLWHEPRAEALWDALAADRPIIGDTRILPRPANLVPNNPAAVKARVDDAAVARALGAAKFVVTDTSAAAPPVRHAGPPVIRYAPGREDDAATLAMALPGARKEAVAGHDAFLDVLVGTDPVTVGSVTWDRNIVDGAPVAGNRLGCVGDGHRLPATTGPARPAP
ncbi:LCP family protein [Streptomyces bambusae]|uniref:LCP family protein n=1 Tax=Streptomyces bambusae TaxID=1550616 RepID=UPI001CFCCC81|nr:LCP family protein [Streptomyces bambusae]MCB5164385.1 LCP family protein [Streptomyces bambusae]